MGMTRSRNLYSAKVYIPYKHLVPSKKAHSHNKILKFAFYRTDMQTKVQWTEHIAHYRPPFPLCPHHPPLPPLCLPPHLLALHSHSPSPPPGYVPLPPASTVASPSVASASESATLDQAIKSLHKSPETTGAAITSGTTNNATAYALHKKKLLAEFIEVMEEN